MADEAEGLCGTGILVVFSKPTGWKPVPLDPAAWVTKIAPGPNYRTITITAQLHNDAWYSDTVTGMVGGRGWRSGETSGLPAPVGGTVIDSNGNPQLGIVESEITGSDGSAQVQMQVSFAAPANNPGVLAAPLLGLAPNVSASSPIDSTS